MFSIQMRIKVIREQKVGTEKYKDWTRNYLSNNKKIREKYKIII